MTSNHSKKIRKKNSFKPFFFLDNHREYIEKSIKLIAKAKYKNMVEKKKQKQT